MDRPSQWKRAKATALEIVFGVKVFLREIDGENDSELVRELDQVRLRIEQLDCDQDFLIPHQLPFPAMNDDPSEDGYGYTDLRIIRIFETAFPFDHRFHDVNRRRMLQSLGAIKRVTQDLRREIRKDSLEGGGPQKM